MTLKNITATMEQKLTEMGASVVVTFINENEFSIHCENAVQFGKALNILRLVKNCALVSTESDPECGEFGYFAF